MIRGNRSMDGGGIDCWDVDSLTVAECVIVDNEAIGRGGGVHVDRWEQPSLIILDRCTLHENRADDLLSPPGGGGVYVDGGTVELTSCIVSSSIGCGLVVGPDSPPPSILSDYCDVWDNQSNDYWGCVAGTHSISLEPLYCGSPPSLALWLHADSPCVGSGQAGANMGALPIGCGTTSVTATPVPAQRVPLSVRPNPVLQRAEFMIGPAGESATLDIYDPLGRLVDSVRPGGAFIWEPGRAVASGVYFARLRGEGVAEVVRFVVLR